MYFAVLFQPGGQIAGKFVRHPTIVLTVGAGVSIVIFLPRLPADSREKAVKAGIEQKNWVERTKRIFYMPRSYRDGVSGITGDVILVKITTFLNLLLGKTGIM